MPILAETALAVLRDHQAELHAAGIRHLALFGSVARGEAAAGSDIDLLARFDPAARMDLFRLAALERRLGELLGTRVDLLAEPVEAPRLRQRIERDLRDVF